MKAVSPPQLPGCIGNLIFDLDGTLIDSVPGIESALSAAFQVAGRTMPTTDFRTVIGPPIKEIARRIEPTLTEAEVLAVERAYRSTYDATAWRDSVAYPAVVETLCLLHQRNLQMFIVTNKPSIPTGNVLAYLGIQHVFRETISRDTRNPHYASKAEMVAELISKWRLDPITTVMIGDTHEDHHAATANQLGFLHAAYGYGALPSAIYPLDQFADVLPFLSRSPLQQ